jgi:hypothetical protein
LEKIVKDPGNNAIHQRVAASLASVAGVVTLDENRNSYNVTGTEAVTAIQGWSAGLVIVKWVSARVLTHSSTFALKGGLSRTCAAGDISILEFTGSNSVREVAAVIAATQPTRQVLTTGSSATYTTPVNCRQLRIRMVGGGGGGGGASASAVSAGSAGGDTSFNSITVKGGAGAASAGSSVAGYGGYSTAVGSGSVDLRRIGSAGGFGFLANSPTGYNGGYGGASLLGSSPQGAIAAPGAGVSAQANSGSGGSGAAYNGANPSAGGGGQGGEYAEFIINNPAGSYTYSVGAGGAGGTGTVNGGDGGSGVIIVDELY